MKNQGNTKEDIKREKKNKTATKQTENNEHLTLNVLTC